MAEPHMLDRRIRVVWMVGAMIPVVALLVIALILAVTDVPIAPPVLAGVAVILGVAGLWFPNARWRSWSYLLTETELIIRFGVAIKVERWLPRTRIQHVDLIGGPIERALGLRQLVIYTAGTREADVTVPGLPVDTAEGLRDDLLSWVRPPSEEARAPINEDADSVAPDPPPSVASVLDTEDDE